MAADLGPSGRPSGQAVAGAARPATAGSTSTYRSIRKPPAAAARAKGLSRIGVVVTVAAVALVGAVFDLGTGSGLRAVFAVLLLLGGVAAAALARRTEIIVALVAVPIVYGGCVLLAAIADLPAGGTLLRTLPYQVVTEIVASTPSLLVATVVTLSVVAFRRLLHAPPLRPRSPNLRRS